MFPGLPATVAPLPVLVPNQTLEAGPFPILILQGPLVQSKFHQVRPPERKHLLLWQRRKVRTRSYTAKGPTLSPQQELSRHLQRQYAECCKAPRNHVNTTMYSTSSLHSDHAQVTANPQYIYIYTIPYLDGLIHPPYPHNSPCRPLHPKKCRRRCRRRHRPSRRGRRGRPSRE